MLPAGRYRYEVRSSGVVVAVEEAVVGPAKITASRPDADGVTIREAEAVPDDVGQINRIGLRYRSSLFQRDATYRADGDCLRGSISAMAGRNEIVIKLGRFGELDVTDLTIFRALILAHVRIRRQSRWTGRVAVIDGSTLVAASLKQTCRLGSSKPSPPAAETLWIYEARMGDVEEIVVNPAGTIAIRRDSRGTETRLDRFEPQAS
jgi:hypothetical protein